MGGGAAGGASARREGLHTTNSMRKIIKRQHCMVDRSCWEVLKWEEERLAELLPEGKGCAHTWVANESFQLLVNDEQQEVFFA